MNEEDVNSPEDAELRLRLSRMPRRNAPSSLMKALRREYMGSRWMGQVWAWFSWQATAGAITAAALVAALWVSYQKSAREQSIDFAPLLAAHSRMQSESLVPDSDMTASDFSAQLAAYYGNH